MVQASFALEDDAVKTVMIIKAVQVQEIGKPKGRSLTLAGALSASLVFYQIKAR